MELSFIITLFIFCTILGLASRNMNKRIKELEGRQQPPDLSTEIAELKETQELQKLQIKQLKNRIITELKK